MMKRTLLIAAAAFAIATTSASADGITGQYIEARTCDVWTGPCFANAEMNLSGKNAVLGWKVDKGTLGDATLDGLGIVAVVSASDTLGLQQTGPSKAVLIVDERADKTQRDALIQMAKERAGSLLARVVAVESAKVDLDVCGCAEGGCGKLSAGAARIETRCLNEKHDKICGNESAFYPPLSKGVTVRAAMAVEHSYTGKGVNETWKDGGRRGAYLGSFETH
jgi:Protein of unknown function (DUF1326)